MDKNGENVLAVLDTLLEDLDISDENVELNPIKLKFILNKNENLHQEIKDEDEKENNREIEQSSEAIFDPDHVNWVCHENEKYVFISFVTHECRSSVRKDILAPFTRFNSKSITFASFKSWSKMTQLSFAGAIAGGKHVNMKWFDAKLCKEAIILPQSHSYFNIDGEIYNNDQAYVKLLPKFINIMGVINPYSKSEETFRQNLLNKNSK